MGIAVVFLLALGVTAVMVYPLLPGRTPPQPAPVATEGEIERAVRHLRRLRSQSELACPACGKDYQEGDQFCVRCGGKLPAAEAATRGTVCPSCGASIRRDDRFCPKCGHNIVVEEAG
jgi:predicted amidophosphoribosyltransferase